MTSDPDEDATVGHGSDAGAIISLFSSLTRADSLRVRVRRHMLRTFPFSRLRARDYRKRLAAFAAPLGRFHNDTEIQSAFAERGALTVPAGDLAFLIGEDVAFHLLCEEARALLAASRERIFENERALNLCPDLYRLGLASAILDLAEDCLGLDCLYLGATLKRECADGLVAGTRQWHLDVEDEKLFRILVYLAPVGADSGPFEFFPRGASQAIKAELHYHSGYVEDARMIAATKAGIPHRCVGAAGDAVIFDGAGVFHRGRAPLIEDRYLVTFAYCSRRPLELRPSAHLPAPLHKRFVSTLSDRQRAAVPPPRIF